MKAQIRIIDDKDKIIEELQKEICKLKEENQTLQAFKKAKKVDLERDNVFIGEDDQEYHKILKKICEGATSVAYKIIDERTSEVMCKKVVKSVDDEQAFKKLRNSLKEFGAIASISHPSICWAIGMNTQEKVTKNTDENGYDKDSGNEEEDKREKTTIALFFEYLPFKLKDFNCNSEKDSDNEDEEFMNNSLRVKIAIEVAFGMNHLHRAGMIHRDLKIENIMLNYILEAKIIDFNLVHVENNDDGSLTKGIGTFDYMSPEMLNNKDYDNKTDVYSYGIVLFVLLTGRLPKRNLTDKMNKKPIEFPNHSLPITSEGIELIKMCTSFEEKDRPSFSDIIEFIGNKKCALMKEIDIDILSGRYEELKQYGV